MKKVQDVAMNRKPCMVVCLAVMGLTIQEAYDEQGQKIDLPREQSIRSLMY